MGPAPLIREKNKTGFGDYRRVIVPAVLIIPLLVLNVLFSPMGPADHGMLFLGSLYALIFTRLSSLDGDLKAGYIQSGEGSLVVMCLLAISAFFSIGAHLAAALCLAFLLVMEYYLHMIGRGTGRSGAWTGFFINLAAIGGGWYLVSRAGVSLPELDAALSGYARYGDGAEIAALAFLALLIPLYPLLLLMGPQTSLFSQGRRYFEITGIGYERARMAFIAARGVSAAAIVLFAGCLAGAGFLAGRSGGRGGPAEEIRFLLIINIFIQSIVLLGAFVSVLVAAASAVALSYVAFIFHRWRISND